MKKLIIGIALALILAVAAVPVVAANGQESLDHVVISPDPGVVIPGGTLQFSATFKDADNDTVVGVNYKWEVVAGGGTIDGNSLFTAGTTTGTFTDTIKVTASKGGITQTDTATVIVANHGELYEVVISPDPALVEISHSLAFSFTAKDAFGGAVVVSHLWEVVGGIGGIDNAGLFTAGVVTGTFPNAIKVTATQAIPSIVKTDTATVKIADRLVLDKVVISPKTATVLVGGTQDFNAIGKNAFNEEILTGISYAWAVTGGGTIDGNGLFSATTTGTFNVTVTATQNIISKSDTALVKVVTESEEHEGRVPPGWSHGKKTGWNGGDTPPGWSKGKKTGWNDEDAPPGLMK
jgi:hypothetical protein